MQSLYQELEDRKQNGLYRKRQPLDSAQGPEVVIDGEQYLNFSSNDYLGLANNAKLKESMIASIEEYGIGAASSQLLVGHSKPHQKLEKRLSDFLDREAALVFPSGYQANLAMASSLIDSSTVVLQDKLNHASLIDAALLSKGKLVRYKHNEPEHLRKLIEKHKQNRLVVMTDGVFSMDGDCARIEEIAAICKDYGALLIVDDAHGIGVLGTTGAGLLEELNIDQEQSPVLIGTFGKSFGASGAFVAGSKELIELLIQKARTYIYTTALMPAVAAMLYDAIDIVAQGQELRANLQKLIKHFKGTISLNNNYQSVSDTHIQPIIIGNTDDTNNLSKQLYNQHVIAPAIRPPTVPSGTSRLRISLTAGHTTEQIDRLFSEL